MNQIKSKITVIGSGWLGLPLCESLMAAGHTVLTTTTSSVKYEKLHRILNIQVFDCLTQIPDKNLTSSDIIIYTIPPLGPGEVERFFNGVDPVHKIIFISSISVYGKSEGATNEESMFNPQTKNGMLLKDCEGHLRSQFKNLTIIRPGGLYDDNRHPIFSLQGKKNLTTGEEFLHLVHRDNCIEAVLKIIELNCWSEDFNLVNDLRILKKDYYPDVARKLGLVPPEYSQTANINPTNISNGKSKKMLALNYKKPKD